MGKSTVIQSLLLLRQSFMQKTIEQGLELNGDLTSIGNPLDALCQWRKDDELSFTLKTVEGITASWVYKYDHNEINLLSPISTEVNPKIYEISLFTDNFHYLTAERIGPRPSFEMSSYNVRQQQQIGVRGEYAAHFLSVFANKKIVREPLRHPDASSEHLKNQVDAWMGEISPGVRINIEEHSTVDLVSLNYQFNVGGDFTNKFRSTNVGFGLTYTMPIVVAVLSAQPGSLLLIENPEAHLHPKGQSQMGKLLAIAAANGIQVIVETHSDHLLNGVRLAVHGGYINPQEVGINFFDRLDNGEHWIQNPEIHRNGRLSFWPEGFFDEWDKSLTALLDPPDER